jgi:hypothetical protein
VALVSDCLPLRCLSASRKRSKLTAQRSCARALPAPPQPMTATSTCRCSNGLRIACTPIISELPVGFYEFGQCLLCVAQQGCREDAVFVLQAFDSPTNPPPMFGETNSPGACEPK